jgi:serine/threonine protein kinase
MATFRLVERIGEGSYSKVYKAISETSQKVLAIKIINFRDAPKSYIQSREIKILRECSHPNIAPLLDFIVNEKTIYLVFEYFPMNLSQYYRYYRNIYNRNLDRTQIRNIIIQVCSALQYLHSKGIMHRDIKPENVMINPSTQEIKLIDFGFAKPVDSNSHTGYMVTRWYRPLEIVLGLEYNQKVDVFAVGAIFLELLLGREMFPSQSNMEQLYMLLNVCGYP